MSLIVSDSSPLISFDLAGFLHVIRSLYGTVVIPPAVQYEIGEVFNPEWMRVQTPYLSITLGRSLHRGEAEAILLALELQAEQDVALLIDDMAGRKAAEFFSLNITGSLGILLKAKQAHLIDKVEPAIDALVSMGGRYHKGVIRSILKQAGELP